MHREMHNINKTQNTNIMVNNLVKKQVEAIPTDKVTQICRNSGEV
jgi:hypothetical protein